MGFLAPLNASPSKNENASKGSHLSATRMIAVLAEAAPTSGRISLSLFIKASPGPPSINESSGTSFSSRSAPAGASKNQFRKFEKLMMLMIRPSKLERPGVDKSTWWSARRN
jgi:hypothetical protein